MPIPPLQATGVLPPNEYQATIAEIVLAFPATTVERQDLNQALQDLQRALTTLKTLAPDVIVYLDGSYVTSKPVHNDIDLLALTDVLDEIRRRSFSPASVRSRSPPWIFMPIPCISGIWSTCSRIPAPIAQKASW